jgi:hypothetical protein
MNALNVWPPNQTPHQIAANQSNARETVRFTR